MISNILDVVNFKVRVPLNKLNGSAVIDILNLFNKKELRILARIGRVKCSDLGNANKITTLLNIARASNRYDLEINITPR